MSREPYQFHYTFHGGQQSWRVRDRNKPIILFLHGFMGSGRDFSDVISLLAPHFCCLTVDLPGHGLTKVLAQESYYEMSATAQALIKLLDKLEIKSCFLVGYSMGGRLALYLAIHFPNYFKQVVLESASPGLKTALERQARIKKDLQLAIALESVDLVQFLHNWYSNPLFASFQKHPKYELTIATRLNNNPLELAKSLRNMSLGKQPNLWNKLDKLQIPIFLLVGQLDNKFIAINREITRLKSQIKLKIIPQCGHNIHLENPQQFAVFIKKIAL